MMKMIGLLRGVNVGGNSRVKMATLKESMSERGFRDVQTYLNSGNVVFDSELNVEETTAILEDILRTDFDVHVFTAVFQAKDILKMSEQQPAWWGTADKTMKHNAIFVLPPTSATEVAAEVGDIKPEYEQVAQAGQVIFWTAPVKTFARTRWSKVVGSKMYGRITIRNANTFKKLVEMSRE